jgi:transcriptional regulator with XRE-family HTH domain
MQMPATATFKVREVDTIYEINGAALKRALDQAGMSQAELARLCGYQSSSRVCHIIKRGRTRISAKPLAKIVNALKKHGVSIEGIVD